MRRCIILIETTSYRLRVASFQAVVSWREKTFRHAIMLGLGKAEGISLSLTSLKNQGKNSGLKMLRSVMIRRVKGESGFRVRMWFDNVVDAKRAAEILAMELKERATSLKLLSNYFKRVLRAELEERVVLWRGKARKSGWRLIMSRKSVFLLAQAMGRRVQRDVRGEIVAWRENKESEYIEWQNRTRLRIVSLNIMRHCVGRITSKKILCLLGSWMLNKTEIITRITAQRYNSIYMMRTLCMRR